MSTANTPRVYDCADIDELASEADRAGYSYDVEFITLADHQAAMKELEEKLYDTEENHIACNMERLAAESRARVAEARLKKALAQRDSTVISLRSDPYEKINELDLELSKITDETEGKGNG